MKTLAKNLPEAKWQQFFEANEFILTLAFLRPVHLAHRQFHAKRSGIDGSGSQIGDLLFLELGQGLAIVEIKKPATPLVRATAYRNNQVFAPSSDLAGAITQTLMQQSDLRQEWLLHRTDERLSRAIPDSIKCVVVAGRYPTEAAQKRSFELFRNASREVDVITFDELLEKLKLLLKHLTPVAQA